MFNYSLQYNLGEDIMIGKVFGILVTVSFVFAAFMGNMENLATAASDSAIRAIELSISLAGSMCLWSGCARVLDKCGFSEMLGKIASPILSKIYPDAHQKDNGIRECASNIAANFLGLGNAALPLGIETMKKFSSNSKLQKNKASDDMVMFAVLATTPFQLLPVTLFALRESSGSVSPYEILIPIWVCEIATTIFAIIICKLLSKVFR